MNLADMEFIQPRRMSLKDYLVIQKGSFYYILEQYFEPSTESDDQEMFHILMDPNIVIQFQDVFLVDIRGFAEICAIRKLKYLEMLERLYNMGNSRVEYRVLQGIPSEAAFKLWREMQSKYGRELHE